MKTKFDSYVCAGDSIQWEKDGFTVTATIEHDADASPDDCECYSPEDIKRWRDDEWFYCGLVLSVARAGMTIERTFQGAWRISAMHRGQFLSRQFMGYTKREAVAEFKAFLRGEA